MRKRALEKNKALNCYKMTILLRYMKALTKSHQFLWYNPSVAVTPIMRMTIYLPFDSKLRLFTAIIGLFNLIKAYKNKMSEEEANLTMSSVASEDLYGLYEFSSMDLIEPISSIKQKSVSFKKHVNNDFEIDKLSAVSSDSELLKQPATKFNPKTASLAEIKHELRKQ